MISSRNIEKVLISAMIILLLLVLFLFAFSQPHSDDFSYYSFIKNKSYSEASYFVYKYSGGRYFSTFLIFLSPLLWKSISGYQWLTALMFLAFIQCVFIAARYVFPESKNDKLAIRIAVYFLFIFIMFMPNLHEFAYWLCAEATYLSAAALWLLICALLCKLTRATFVHQKKQWFLLNLFILLALGCSEWVMLSLLLPLLLQAYYLKTKYNKIPIAYFISCATYLIATLLISISSGNMGRQEISPYSGNILLALGGGIYAGFSQLILWSPFLIPFSVLFTKLFKSYLLHHQDNVFLTAPFFNIKWLAAIILTAFFLSQIAVVAMTGSVPESRFQNLMLLFILTGIVFINYVALNNNQCFVTNKVLLNKLAFPVLITIFFVFPNNFKAAIIDVFSGSAYHFNLESKARYNTILSQKDSIIAVSPLKNRPKLLYYPSLSCQKLPDTADIPRLRLAEYFGKTWIYEYPCSVKTDTSKLKTYLKQLRNQYFNKNN